MTARDALYYLPKHGSRALRVFLNYAGSIDSMMQGRQWGTFHHKPEYDEQLQKFAPEALQQLYRDYKTSMHVSVNATGMDALDVYINALPSDVKTLIEQSAEADEKKNLRNLTPDDKNSFNDILNTRPDNIKDLQAEFNKLLEFIQENKDKPDFEAEDLIDYMGNLRDRSNKALSAYQTQMTQQITDKFAEPELTPAIQALQDSTIKTLNASCKKAQETFNKTMTDSITNLHSAAAQERSRIVFLNSLMHDKKLKQAIEEFAKKEAAKPDNKGAEIAITFQKPDELSDFDKGSLKGVNLVKLLEMQTAIGGALTTMTGRAKITIANGSIHLQLPNRIWDSQYYHSLKDNVKADLLVLAHGIKSQGHKCIEMNFKHPSDEHSQEIARQTYEACREAGFKDNEITITMNGHPFQLLKKNEVDKDGKPRETAGLLTPAAKQLIDEDEKLRQSQLKTTGDYRKFMSALEKPKPTSSAPSMPGAQASQ